MNPRPTRQRLLGFGARTRVREAIVGREGTEAMMHRFLLAQDEVPAAIGELLATNRLAAFTHRTPTGVADPDEEVARLADLIASVGRVIDQGGPGASNSDPNSLSDSHSAISPAVEIHLNVATLGGGADLDGATARALLLAKDARALGIGVTMAASTWDEADATIELYRQVRAVQPQVALTIAAQRFRSERDVQAIAAPGARIRLVRGGFAEPAEVAWTSKHEVNLSWVRCLSAALAAGARPLLCTHSAQLLEVSAALIGKFGVPATSYEFQLWRGVRPTDQWRLADAGHQVRTLVPWTTTRAERYDYFLERGTQPLERETFDPRDAYWRL